MFLMFPEKSGECYFVEAHYLSNNNSIGRFVLKLISAKKKNILKITT